jgi:L-cysteate sulfo-lyase
MHKLPLAKLQLGHWPTPLEPMLRLNQLHKGPELWVKRDDCSGLAMGGNKTRKLEYLLADAQQQGVTTLLTAGGVQSNHARQTAAAAAKVGLGCELF